jgi:hypothetical protein
MAVRVSQQMLQQVATNFNAMRQDLSEMASRQRDLQYRFLAYQSLTDVSSDDVNKKAEELQVVDFDEASAKDDADRNLEVIDTVEEDSVIIFTTTVDGSTGYLRSKQSLSELHFPGLKEQLLGKVVGDTAEVEIENKVHTLTLLGIRKPPVEQEIDFTEEQGVAVEQQQEDGQPVSAQA